jgi:23S rRNA pseudouridine1911/1915/1917 synthase
MRRLAARCALGQALSRTLAQPPAGLAEEGLIRLDGAKSSRRQAQGLWRRECIAAVCPRSGIPGTQGAPAPTLESAAEDIALNVVHEDDDLIVIDKPAGLVVHPGNGKPRVRC